MVELKILESIGATIIGLAVTILTIIYWKYAAIKDQIQPEEQQVDKDSKVLVILPISREYNQMHQNQVWDNCLTQKYPGYVRYCFVCESTSDPAFSHFITYMMSRGYEDVKANQIIQSKFSEKDEIKIVITGKSYHNSQKIHNMLTGIINNCQVVDSQATPIQQILDNKSSIKYDNSMKNMRYYENNGYRFPFDYIAFFDDDLEVTPQTLTQLIYPLENDNTVGISTGYSVEVPSQPKLSQYAVMIYRTINLLGFATTNVNYCWGGCFGCRGSDFFQSKLPAIWLDGGYSDDMIVGNYCKQIHKRIYASPLNMFRNRPHCNTTFSQHYYNYVRRQYFTLTTYFCTKDRIISYIALAQLLTGGIVTLSFSLLVVTDFFYQLYIKNIIQACRVIAIALIVLFTIGKSINRAINSLEAQIARCNNKSESQTQLNALLTGFSLIIHFICTIFMVLSVSVSESIQWGPSIYTFQNGRVHKVQRQVRGQLVDNVNNGEHQHNQEYLLDAEQRDETIKQDGSVDKAQSLFTTLMGYPAYSMLNFE